MYLSVFGILQCPTYTNIIPIALAESSQDSRGLLSSMINAIDKIVLNH